MDFEVYLNEIEICDGGREVFEFLNAKVDSDMIALAYDAYDAGDDAFAAYLEDFAKAQNVTTEEANLFWYLHLSGRTYRLYQEKNIDDSVFYATMKAFAGACVRCYEEFGVYGIQQRVYRAWYRRQLAGILFRIGRLEFEIVCSNYDVTLEGFSLAKGDTCISVHIPRGEALDPCESEAAYALARDFFKEKFQISPCIFYCGSWLLHPWISEDFTESSRIVQFQKQYTLVDVIQDEVIVRDWLFDNSDAPLEALPVRTSMHKAAQRRLINGLPIGQAKGYRL